MRAERSFALFALISLGWTGFSLLDFYLTTQNSDCPYTAAEACTHFARAEQTMIIWRWLAIELAAVVALIMIRKR